MEHSILNLLRRALTIQHAGSRISGCLLVRARGSTPQSPGALMLVDDAANTYGTIGGGCIEAEVRKRAVQMISAQQSGLLTFKLDHDYGWDDGLICGGTLELAIGPLPEANVLEETVRCIEQRQPTSLSFDVKTDEGSATYTLNLPPRERLYIAGAGHIGQAAARHGLHLDFAVTMFDDRHDLLDRLAPDGVTKITGDIAEQLGTAPIDGATYCLIVTRGHRHDEAALAAVVGRGAHYVGMIGSRRKVKLIFDDLIERGVSAEELADVKAPVGLDIGAVSVEEIAISIAAQLVEARRATGVPAVTGPASQSSGCAANPKRN